MLFEPQHYGKPISNELSLYLREHTTTDDRHEAAGELDRVSESSIRGVVYKDHVLTERNAPGIIQLIRIAHRNAITGKTKMNEAQQYFAKKLELVEN